MEVRPMQRSERRAVGRLLARAFDEDPGFVHVLPTGWKRRRVLPTVFADAARDAAAHGRADVALLDSQPAGALLWFGPGGYPPDDRRALRSMPAQLRAALWAPTRVGLGTETLELMHRHQPARPFVYIATLAADPAAQGRGVGSALLRDALAHADAEGLPTYLETAKPANRSWYARFGFAEREALELPRGGPPIWTMLRPARR